MSTDFYYRKLMGNGTVASKFRLNVNQSDVRKSLKGDPENLPLFLEPSFETSGTHHLSNCVRCYRLKKKCSRTYPRCSYCTKTGSQCDYVDRRNKRRKKELEEGDSDPLEPSSSVSIASLVHRDDNEELFRHIDLPATSNGTTVVRSNVGSQTAAKADRNGHDSAARNGVFGSLHSRMLRSPTLDVNRQNLQDQFLVVRAIEDESLPLVFVHTFFANYEWKYPFLNLVLFLEKFKSISFKNDTFVNMDVYLVMAVGCILYDSNNNTQYSQDFFSVKLIESIVDVISYDIRSEEDLHTAHLLILLCIYAINVSNGNLVWNVVGFLNRLLIFLTDFTGKNNQCMRKRCFWTIFNLDKELSLLLDKPSQFMPTQIIKLESTFGDTLHTGEKDSLASLMEQSVSIHLLQDRMISLKLGLSEKLAEALTQYSSDLDKWRVAILLLIHKEYAELPLLQNFIGLIHLDFYYLLIELDQVSSTKSFQFTLQFLSNSFSLLLNELTGKKGVVGTSLYSLFWFKKFFKVVDFNIESLLRILRDNLTLAELSTLLAEFNSNLQLIINLLKFLVDSRHRPEQYLEKLNGSVTKLTLLNTKLMGFNSFAATREELDALVKEVEAIIG
ncbi:CIC11C00000004723 [Sungouiella intermedia]|uniref:CIC11C00000004723 n=1 Tax=Sungouiella intermedia TaxID=45354 RepID=A0A1L0DHD5_9ASCO|nr:CIC11C00000004723 [[Candida] intermedia]